MRVAYALQASSTPLAEVLLLDSEFYDRQARSLLAGSGWTEGVFFMNPLYPYLLALLYMVAGPGWGVVVGVQVLVGTATCWLVYAVGLRTWGRQVGLVGAGLGAVYGVFIFYDGAFLTATAILFLNLLGLYLLLRWRSEQHTPWLWLAGVCFGLSALARPLVLIWVLFLGAWFAGRRQWRSWVPLVLGCGLVLTPVVLRNWIVGGEPALTTSSAGMNFYVGNHPRATGIYAQVEFVPSAEPDQEREGFVREAERRQGQPMTPGSASAYWLAEGLRFIRQEPGVYLHLLWRKFLLFWHEVEAQNNLSYYFAQEWVPFLHLTPGWGLLAPLGLAGWVLWGRQRREVLLELYVLAYLVGCLVFFVSSEYRLPVVPVLLLWAGLGLTEAQRAWRARRLRPLAGAVAALIAFGALIHFPDPLAERLRSMRVDFYNFAVLYERKGNPDQARALAGRCLAIDPGFAPAQQLLDRLDAPRSGQGMAGEEGEVARGLRLYGEGDFRGAAEVFSGLIARTPGQGRWHNSLGLCYYKLGEYRLAEGHYLQALLLNPDHAAAHYNLGLLRLAQLQPDAAVASLQRAVDLDPQYRAARYRLGEVLARQGELAGALLAWKALLAQTPEDQILQGKVDSLQRLSRGGIQ